MSQHDRRCHPEPTPQRRPSCHSEPMPQLRPEAYPAEGPWRRCHPERSRRILRVACTRCSGYAQVVRCGGALVGFAHGKKGICGFLVQRQTSGGRGGFRFPPYGPPTPPCNPLNRPLNRRGAHRVGAFAPKPDTRVIPSRRRCIHAVSFRALARNLGGFVYTQDSLGYGPQHDTLFYPISVSFIFFSFQRKENVSRSRPNKKRADLAHRSVYGGRLQGAWPVSNPRKGS